MVDTLEPDHSKINSLFKLGKDDFLIELPESCRASMPSTNHKESPSSIVNYVSCPYKWWIERYLPLEGDGSSYPGIIGTFVHRVAEVFYNEPPELRTEKMLNDVFQTAWNSIKSGKLNGIIDEGSQAEFTKFVEAADNPNSVLGGMYKQARTSIQNLIDFDGDPAKVDIVSNEMWVRCQKNSVKINGKIDRVRRDSMGRIIVDDYKTGRAPSDDDMSLTNTTFIPCYLYAYMYSEKVALSRNDIFDQVYAIKLLYLKELQRFTLKVKPQDIVDAESLIETVTSKMREAATTLEVAVKPAKKETQDQCYFCSGRTLGICPVWNESGTLQELEELMEKVTE